MSLVARVLEAAGFPTVIMGCAPDIVSHCGAPRMLASDFPLGNSAGRPFDPAAQDATLAQALSMYHGASEPGTLVRSRLRWNDGNEDWKEDFMNVDRLSSAEIASRRLAFQRQKETAREINAKSPGSNRT